MINRISGNEGEQLKTLAENSGLSVAGLVPYDSMVLDYDLHGRPIVQLPADSIAVRAVFGILDTLKIP